MELIKNLFTSKNFYEMACVAQDQNAFVVINRKSVDVRPLTQIENFIREEMVCVYQGPRARLCILDNKGKVVKPFIFDCSTLELCPHFFGKGWVLADSQSSILPLTPEVWAELGWGTRTDLN